MIRNLLIDRTNWSGAAILGETSCTYRDLARQALAISEILAEKDDKNVAIFLPTESVSLPRCSEYSWREKLLFPSMRA